MLGVGCGSGVRTCTRMHTHAHTRMRAPVGGAPSWGGASPGCSSPGTGPTPRASRAVYPSADQVSSASSHAPEAPGPRVPWAV